jgi:cytoskeletal protein RodZ
MSSEDLDQLFRNKLNNHEADPSPEAWNRLEEKLQQRKAGVLWRNWSMAIAASLFLAFGTWALLIQQPEQNTHLVSTQAADTISEAPVQTVEKPEDSQNAPRSTEVAKPDQRSNPVKVQKPVKPIHQHKALLAAAPAKKDQYVQVTPVQEPKAIENVQMAMTKRDTLPTMLPPQPIEEGIKVTLALADLPQEVTNQVAPKEKPLKTLFKQLKALKKGEDVSLKDIKATGQMLIAGTVKTNDEE